MRINVRLTVSLLLFVLAFPASPVQAVNLPIRCEASKLKVASKYSACLLKAESKAVSRGVPAETSRCAGKFSNDWGKTEDRVGVGVCPSEDDEVDIDDRITLDTAEIATLLSGATLPECGDGTADAGEQCDNADLAGADCIGLGFSAGTLVCDGSCFFDLSGCMAFPVACGDGSIDAGEQCDGSDLNGSSCTSLGFTDGALGCRTSCFYDMSACTGVCGDGSVNAGEHCDGGDLNGSSCTSLGFTDGALGCRTSCFYDMSACTGTSEFARLIGIDPIVTATGQVTAFGSGSDGDVQAGAALSYTDNGDGTVTDNNTGLMWEKKDGNGGSIHYWENQYTFSPGTNEMEGTIVTTFLATLNAGEGFAGHTDWRIPNYKELMGILDLGVASPAVHAAFYTPGCTSCADVTLMTCSCTTHATYWSSTTFVADGNKAWSVDFSLGTVSYGNKWINRFARAVRGGL